MSEETIEAQTRRLVGKISPYLRDHGLIEDNEYDIDFLTEVVAAAIAEERETIGWQPMETAPKDGKTIDLFVCGDRIPDCSWHGGQWMAYGVDDFESLGYFAITGDPTHWIRVVAPKDEVSGGT